jgi:hypothetical protein
MKVVHKSKSCRIIVKKNGRFYLQWRPFWWVFWWETYSDPWGKYVYEKEEDALIDYERLRDEGPAGLAML